MEIAIWIVSINWGLPIIGFGLYFLITWLVFKDYVFEGFHGIFPKMRLVNKGEIDDPIEPWHAKLWKDWWGVCLHVAIGYRDRPGKWDDAQVKRGLIHEGTHGYQQLLGLIFWVIYFGHMGLILVTQKIKGKPYTKHAYLDCVWERQARKRAGQLVDIPPEQWKHGPNDIWPWW
jgi:hypothetical protein